MGNIFLVPQKILSGQGSIQELGQHIQGKGKKALIVTDKFMFTVPGDGDVDFAPVFDIVNQSEYEGWYIVEAEQDPAKANPLEYAQIARKYIRQEAKL